MTTFQGHEIIFGTYFLNCLCDEAGLDGVQEIGEALQKKPQKAIPVAIMVGINSTNEINGKPERLSFIDTCALIDKTEGGIVSKEVTDLLGEMFKGFQTNLPQEGNAKPAVKKK
jgi:hypothetical protein